MKFLKLFEKKCKPCEGGVEPLTRTQVHHLLDEVYGWILNGDKISKSFKFKDFVEAMKFVNKVADLAEQEGHHPDIFIHWNQVRFELWTHVIKGLSENDFILASKIDKLHSH